MSMWVSKEASGHQQSSLWMYINLQPHFKLQNAIFQKVAFPHYNFWKSFVFWIPEFRIVNHLGKLWKSIKLNIIEYRMSSQSGVIIQFGWTNFDKNSRILDNLNYVGPSISALWSYPNLCHLILASLLCPLILPHLCLLILPSLPSDPSSNIPTEFLKNWNLKCKCKLCTNRKSISFSTDGQC